jgi:hypothetical protein
MPRPRAERIIRVLLLGIASVVGGALMGGTAAYLMAPVNGPFGGIFGGMLGFLLSPVLVYSLYRKHLRIGCLVVFLPSLGFAAATARLLVNMPPLSLIATGLVYVALCIWARGFLKDEDTDEVRCPTCGYSREGLAADAVCPECGTSA